MNLPAMNVLMCLLSVLVEVHSQIAPTLTIMGANLPNNSYLKQTDLGTMGDKAVKCNTDLVTCCGIKQNQHRGDWFLPNGTRLPSSGQGAIDGFYNIHFDQRVELRHDNSNGLPDIAGIFKCTIETNAVNSDDPLDDSTTRETLYLGIYLSGGESINWYNNIYIIYIAP